MQAWPAGSGPTTAGGRRRLAVAAAFAFAALVHLGLLALIWSWRPPPVLASAAAIEVALIPGDGGAVSHVATMQPPKPEPVPPKEPDLKPPPPKPSDPPSAPKVSSSPSPLLTRKADPTALIADVALGGASLTAEPVAAQPIALTAQPSPTPTTPGGQRCDILQGLKANLQSSDQVQAALGRIPTRARSVANAILLWDGEWIDPLSVGGVAAIDPIEQAVALTVRSAPADCQTELMRGPRLIIIGDVRNAMVLAFGSGEWRWTDLVATLPPNPG